MGPEVCVRIISLRDNLVNAEISSRRTAACDWHSRRADVVLLFGAKFFFHPSTFGSDGSHRQTPLPACSAHRLAFLAPVAVLSVGGVCVRNERGRKERRAWKQRFKALMVFKKTPSKAKDEVNHLGAALLEGI